LVVAGVVELEVADELVVDEHGGVVVVDVDGGCVAGVFGSDVDAEGAAGLDSHGAAVADREVVCGGGPCWSWEWFADGL
jgi:hypothetical protein